MKLIEGLQYEPITVLDLSHYCTVSAGAPLRDVIETMRSTRQNCALVLDDGKLVGILTDRDIMRKVVDHPEIWEQPVDDLMSAAPRTLDEHATAASAIALMEEHHFRNVPVVTSDGEVVGNFTHFAVVKLVADVFPAEVYNRPPDPTRFARRRHGA